MRIAGLTAAAALGTLAVAFFSSPAVAGEENKDWSPEAAIVAVSVPQDREYGIQDREYVVQDREYVVQDREYSVQGTRVTSVNAA